MAAADVLSVHLALAEGHPRLRERRPAVAPEAGRVLRQHGAGRGGGSGGARPPRSATAASASALDVFAAEPAGGHRAVRRRHRAAPGCLWHPSHRRLDRPGSGGDRRRDRAHRPHLQGHRPGAERGEPGSDDAGDAHAGGAAPRSPRCAGARVRRDPRRRAERAGDRERDLRRRGSGRRPHQPRRRAEPRHRGRRARPRRGARRPARVPGRLVPASLVPDMSAAQASSTSPPAPPSCLNPCCSKRSAISSPCRASACRCSRSAIARRPSKRFSPRPRPTCGPSAACRRTTRCSSCRVARRSSSRWCR